MKLRGLFTLLIISLLIVTGCSWEKKNIISPSFSTVSNKEFDSQSLNKDFPFLLIDSTEVKKIKSGGSSVAEVSKEYNDLEEMVKLSHAIFKGTVINVAYFDKDGTTCTKYAVKISDVFKGTLTKDDVVNVIELGGVTTAYNRIQLFGKEKEFPNISEDDSKKLYVEVGWNGTPLSVVGDKVLLLAYQDTKDYWNLPKDYYYAKGYKDGKFNIEGTNVERKSMDKNRNSLKMSEENIDAQIKKYMAKA